MVSKWVITCLQVEYIGVITHLYTNLLLTSWDVQVTVEDANKQNPTKNLP